jgi:hypothetical protein
MLKKKSDHHKHMKLIESNMTCGAVLATMEKLFGYLRESGETRGKGIYEPEPYFLGSQNPFGDSDIQISSFAHQFSIFFPQDSLNFEVDMGTDDTDMGIAYLRIIFRAAKLAPEGAAVPLAWGNKLVQVEYLFSREGAVARKIRINNLDVEAFPEMGRVTHCPGVLWLGRFVHLVLEGTGEVTLEDFFHDQPLLR